MRELARHLRAGLRHGYPWHCVAHFALERALRGGPSDQRRRRGKRLHRANAAGRHWYVPCAWCLLRGR